VKRAASARRPRVRAKIPFRSIADATYDWESWHARDGEVLWVNPAVERITGYDVPSALAMKRYPLPIVLAEDRAKLARILEGARAGSAGNDVEFRVRRRDGGIRWAAISWQSFADERGRSLGFRTSVRDIDERKRAERRLHEALGVAEQAAASRQAFLANTSHELRTPLQSILGYAQLLASGERDAEKRRKLEIVVQQTESLLAMVSNVLEAAALQVKAPEIVEEEFDLRPKVESVVEAMRPLATGKPLSLRLRVDARVPRRVRGDRLRVRQVLTNLIANAVKFTERGHVEVRVARAPRGRIRFSVEDTGIGIAKRDRTELFTPFTRAGEELRRGHGGSGLGLSIAKALTDAMGGTLRVRSRPGVGSCFTLELPLATVADRIRAPARAATGDGGPPRCRVLVVDDSPAGRELLREMLQGLGAEVSLAASGEEAVQRVQAEPPDLILMDLQMPGLDGAATTQLIRAQAPAGVPRPRIVALTANAFGRAHALGPSGGMDGFLVKPARQADLRALLDRIRDAVDGETARALVSGTHPLVSSDALDRAVVEDLALARGRDGRSLLQIAGARVLEDTPGCLRQLDAALAKRAPREAALLAHRIKGNCLMVGAAATARAAEALEDAIKEADAKRTIACRRALGASFAELEGVLRKRMADPPGDDAVGVGDRGRAPRVRANRRRRPSAGRP